MNEQIIQSALKHYIDSGTEELLELWLDNDPDLLSPEGFEAIRQILSERLGSIPEKVDWDETNARRSIDISDNPIGRPRAVPSSYRLATSTTRLLQTAVVACAVLGFVVFLIFSYVWQETNLLKGFFNVKGLIASIALFVIQGILALLARHLWVRSKQIRMPQIEEVAANRKQPPIIYLRPFDADHSTGSPEPRFSGVFGLGVLQQARQPTFEEMMVATLDQEGPVIAIGRPGERFSPVGAVREYLDSEKWRERVIALIEKAQIVILAIGTSQGLLFELAEVYKRRGIRNLILVWDAFALGKNPSESSLKTVWSEFYLKFKEITGLKLPRRIDFNHTLLLCFLPNEDMRLIIGSRRNALEWYAAFHVAKSLVVGKEPDLVRNKRQRQVVPWIIFAWYFLGFIGYLAASWSGIVTPELEELGARVPWGIWLSIILNLMDFTGAILLLMRRRLAVWLFAASLAISLLNGVMMGGFVRPPSADISQWIAVILLGYGVSVAICIYSWRLLKRGVLR